MSSKAVILGMNNPLSPDPRHALFPHPPGCTGWRIWRMLVSRLPEVTRGQYMRGFERTNLVDSAEWDRETAEQRAAELPSLYAGRTIVVLGDAPRRALGLPKMLIHPLRWRGCEWRQLPHPSGRCCWYNDPECRDLAASLLAELYLRGQQDGGVT